MAVYRRSARSRLTLVLLVLTSVTLVTLDERGAAVLGAARDAAREVMAPVQSVSDNLLAPVGDVVGGILHYGDIEAENARLREENTDLRGAVLRADDAERERQALRDQLDLAFAADIPRVTTHVVGGSRSNFELTVELDKGTDDGVGVGMPVVDGVGLVGRVLDVSVSRAVVLLLVDRGFSAGIRLASSGDTGSATGGGRGRPLRLDLIDPATVVAPGEVVLTSGLQSRFPAGIPVGRVGRADTPTNALQQDIAVDPVVDLRRLAFVSVLQWPPR